MASDARHSKNGVCLSFGWIGNCGMCPGCYNGGRLRCPDSASVIENAIAHAVPNRIEADSLLHLSRPPRALLVGASDGELRRRLARYVPAPRELCSWARQMVSYGAAERFRIACIEYSPNVPT